MSTMSWDDIQSVTGGRWIIDPTANSALPSGAAIDTRELVNGQMFVAYVGVHTDGHAYLTQAQMRGASMCIITDERRMPDSLSIPVLLVDDPTEAMTLLAKRYRSTLNATIIGVTGSNGKTTATRLIHAVLRQAGNAWVSSKSHNNAIGVPMSVLNTPNDAQYGIYEIGTSSPGEIHARSSLIEPDISVITSIGRAHLEELGSLSGVCREKASILGCTKSVGFVPGGNNELDAAISDLDPSCDIERLSAGNLRSVVVQEQSVEFELDGAAFKAPVPGKHNAINAAYAVRVGRACGLDDATIAQGLQNAQLPEMRLDRVEIPTNEDPIIVYNDAYNANPDSTRAALEFFGDLQASSNQAHFKKIMVLGDMLELGDAGPDEHASVLSELDESAGRVILVGELYCQAAQRVNSPIEDCYVLSDMYTMTEIARSIRPGDVVLLKGSRGIGLERLVYVLINRFTPFVNAGASMSWGHQNR